MYCRYRETGRRANARNVRLYCPYRQYNYLFIFRLYCVCLFAFVLFSFVCLSVRLFIQSVCLFIVCLSVYLLACLFACLSVCLFCLCLSVCVFVYSVCCVYLSVCLFVRLFILSVCLSVCLCVSLTALGFFRWTCSPSPCWSMRSFLDADSVVERMEDPSFHCLYRVLPYADQKSWSSITAFIPLSTEDQGNVFSLGVLSAI